MHLYDGAEGSHDLYDSINRETLSVFRLLFECKAGGEWKRQGTDLDSLKCLRKKPWDFGASLMVYIAKDGFPIKFVLEGILAFGVNIYLNL